MDKRKNIDNFLKMQKRFNEKTHVEGSKTKRIVEKRIIDYGQIHKRFKILCNNSINGGDCHGETMCVCKCFLYDKNYSKYYSKEPDKDSLHHDFTCNACVYHICGCCYSSCPNCGESVNIQVLPW